jgi:hypothetical protein
MDNTVQIIFDAVDNTQGAINGLQGSMTELNSTIMVAQQVMRTLKDVYDDTIGAAVSYADAVNQVSLMSGASTEASSRLVNVFGLLGVSTNSLELAMRFMAKNGVEPSIDGVKRLSDVYLSLAPGVERDQFLIKEFGRSGTDLAFVMSQGSAKIDELNNSINRNLILTPQQTAAAIHLKESQAELNQSWEASKVTIGNALVPAMQWLTDSFNRQAQAEDMATQLGYNWGTMTTAQRAQVYLVVDAEKTHTAALDASDRAQSAAAYSSNVYTESLKQQAADVKSLVDSIVNLYDEDSKFNQKQIDIQTQLAKDNADLKSGKMSTTEYADAIAKLNDELAKNAADHLKWAKDVVFAMAEAKGAAMIAADPNSSDSVEAFLIKLGVQLGLTDDATANAMIGITKSINGVDLNNPTDALNAVGTAYKDLVSQSTTPITITVNADVPQWIIDPSTAGKRSWNQKWMQNPAWQPGQTGPTNPSDAPPAPGVGQNKFNQDASAAAPAAAAYGQLGDSVNTAAQKTILLYTSTDLVNKSLGVTVATAPTVQASLQDIINPTQALNTAAFDAYHSIASINDNLRNLDGMHSVAYVTVITNYVGGTPPTGTGGDWSEGKPQWTGGQAFSSGGYASGGGTSVSDSISARLSKGEFVIRAASVNQPGMLDNLNYLNRTGQMPNQKQPQHIHIHLPDAAFDRNNPMDDLSFVSA